MAETKQATAATVADIYPEKWLKAHHLQDKPVTVKIEGVDVEELRLPDGTKQISAILSFPKTSKRLILNRTMCKELIAATGTERLQEWIGHRITLYPSIAPNHKETIRIGAAHDATEPAKASGGDPGAAGGADPGPGTGAGSGAAAGAPG